MRVTIPDLIKEHEEMVAILKSGDPKKIAKLAKEQEAELKKYKKALQTKDNPSKANLYKEDFEGAYQKSKITKNSDGVIVSLPWVDRVFFLNEGMRIDKVDRIKERLKIFKKGKQSKEGDSLVEWLSNSKEFELYGFIPNISYIRAKEGNPNDLNYMFIHAFGTPTLLYAHKKLPILIVSNPELMSNDSIAYHLNKIPFDKRGKGIHG